MAKLLRILGAITLILSILLLAGPRETGGLGWPALLFAGAVFYAADYAKRHDIDFLS